MEERVT